MSTRNRQPSAKLLAAQSAEKARAQQDRRAFTSAKKKLALTAKTTSTTGTARKKAAAAGSQTEAVFAANLAARSSGIVPVQSRPATTAGQRRPLTGIQTPVPTRPVPAVTATLQKQVGRASSQRIVKPRLPAAIVNTPLEDDDEDPEEDDEDEDEDVNNGRQRPAPHRRTHNDDDDDDDDDIPPHRACNNSRRIPDDDDDNEDDGDIAPQHHRTNTRRNEDDEDDDDDQLGYEMEDHGDYERDMEDRQQGSAEEAGGAGAGRAHVEAGGDDGAQGDDEKSDDEGSVRVGSKRKFRGRRRGPRNAKKARSSDLDPQTNVLVMYATSLCRILALTQAPWPSPEDSVNMVDQAWTTASDVYPAYEPDAGVEWFALIKRAFWNARGRLRDRVRPHILQVYGFDQRPRKAESNRRRYLRLIDGDAYLCEDTKNRNGMWFSTILYLTIKSMWFETTKDGGLAFEAYFKPIRAETIAIVFTAVRLCLDEWRTGTRKTIEFKANTYEPVYDLLLANLCSITEVEKDFIKDLGMELWNDCSAGLDKAAAGSITVSHTEDQITATLRYAEERRRRRALAIADPDSDDE